MTRSDGSPRVYMLPDYTDSNPYQIGLIGGLEDAGVQVVPIPADGMFPILSAWKTRGRPDAVHLHWVHRFIDTDRRFSRVLATCLAIRTLLEILVLRVSGIPVVWTVHNVVSHEKRHPRIERRYRQLVARAVDSLIVHCEAAREIVADAYRLSASDRENIAAVPHGNYDPFYENTISQPEAREQLNLPADAPVFLFFGMIREYKRVPRLIEKFSEINDDRAILLVVGNPWSPELETEVRRATQNQQNVRTVLEYVPDEDVGAYLAGADAIVLPYDGILTSGSAILGMTFGRAVIAPERGCLPSLLGAHGGITYDPDNSDGLAVSLSRAMNDRDRLKTMGQRNRRVADQLDWAEIGDLTASAYFPSAARE